MKLDSTSHLTALSEAERVRYSRQLRLPSCGEAGQRALKGASVLVIGAGGLGCAVLTALVSAGVGRVVIFDFDHVSLSNLHRQPLYTASDVGALKVEAARSRLSALNPHVVIETCASPLLPRGALSPEASLLLRELDLIIDCVDRFDARLIAARYAHDLGVPHCYGAVSAESGQVALFEPHAACLCCLFPTLPGGGVIQSCDQGGVLGVAPQLIGSMQATLALNYLLRPTRSTQSSGDHDEVRGGITDLEMTTLTQVSLEPLNVYQLEVKRRDDCILCKTVQTRAPRVTDDLIHNHERSPEYVHPISSLGARALLASERPPLTLDVRDTAERSYGMIAGAQGLAMRDLERLCTSTLALLRSDPSGEPPQALRALISGDVIVYCERGPRAERAAAQLAQLRGALRELRGAPQDQESSRESSGVVYELIGGYQGWCYTSTP